MSARAFLARGAALGLALTITLGAAGLAHAQGLTLNDLIEKAKQLDATEVVVHGEVIGEVMIRGESGWVNINDGTAALGVWAPADQLRQIQKSGRYGVRGDKIEVTGTFYRMDTQNGGELDIQGKQLRVISAGGLEPEPVSTGRIAWTLVFALSTAVTAGAFWWRRRHAQGEVKHI